MDDKYLFLQESKSDDLDSQLSLDLLYSEEIVPLSRAVVVTSLKYILSNEHYNLCGSWIYCTTSY